MIASPRDQLSKVSWGLSETFRLCQSVWLCTLQRSSHGPSLWQALRGFIICCALWVMAHCSTSNSTWIQVSRLLLKGPSFWIVWHTWLDTLFIFWLDCQATSAIARKFHWVRSPLSCGPSGPGRQPTCLPALTDPQSSTPVTTNWSSPMSTCERSTTCLRCTLMGTLTGEWNLPEKVWTQSSSKAVEKKLCCS